MPGLVARLFGRRPAPDPMADPAILARQGSAVRARLEGELGLRNRAGRRGALFVVRDFLSPAECAALISLIEGEIGPSTLFNDGGGSVRTSSTHYFAESEALPLRLGERIDALLGLDRAQAETLQGQRYLSGEEYRHHCDFFRIERLHWQTERGRGGQRNWTAMAYLNNVERGGATEFPRLDLTLKPETGMLVVWDNMTRSGEPNRAMIHAGLPVEAGNKYVVTQWYRQSEWRRSPG